MESNQNTSLFNLAVDENSKVHLKEAAKWAKFLAIVGFIMCGLIVIIGIFFGTFFSTLTDRYGGGRYDNNLDFNSSGLGAAMGIMYALIALLYFFPCLFLFYFADKMKIALNSNDQNTLNGSFQNLKKMFRYVGVLTIIVLTFYILAALIALLAAGGR